MPPLPTDAGGPDTPRVQDGLTAAPRADADAAAARTFSFLAAALASSPDPDREALAAEIAQILDVPTLAVVHRQPTGTDTVMAFGFPVSEPLDVLDRDLIDGAIEQGLPVGVDGAEQRGPGTSGLRSLLVVPIRYAGRPWGALVVGSGLPGAFDREVATRVRTVASGLAIVLSALVPDADTPALSRERRLRQGFEAIVRAVAGIVEDATPAAAAQALADASHVHLGWDRVVFASHRPALGLVPLAVAGTNVELADVVTAAIAAEATTIEPVTDGTPGRVLFDGSRSQILLPLGPEPVGLSGIVSVESPTPGAFDDVDLHLARALAALVGPLLARLGTRTERKALVAKVEQADRRQRRRFTSLAHELRTPVTVMLGYADLLAAGDEQAITPLDEGQRREYAQTLARHARALGRMVDNALVAWQLDDGSLELSLTTVPVEQMVLEATRSLGMEPDLQAVERTNVLADAFWLPRIIAALLDNARRYVPEADVHVACRVVGEKVRIAVHDDGPGIGGEDVDHVFDAFHRGPDGGTSPHRGVGLGLTVARSLARAMGGELTVASAEDYGTTFTIELPVA